MKRKLLLAGRNQATIDDFFYALYEDFECLTTSIRNVDIIKHIEYFQPDAFVYCFASEQKDELLKLITALESLDRRSLKMIIIGDSEVCNEFLRLRAEQVSLTLLKPITASSVKTQINKYFEEQKLLEEQARERAESSRLVKEVQELLENTKKHILVIDDDPIMLRLIKQELKEDYTIATAVSGKIGLNFLERKKTDLILLDYEMPEESGAEVLEKLRKDDRTKDIPVVFLTGINDREKIQKVLSMKPQGYLLKPIEHEKLVQTINQILG